MGWDLRRSEAELRPGEVVAEDLAGTSAVAEEEVVFVGEVEVAVPEWAPLRVRSAAG